MGWVGGKSDGAEVLVAGVTRTSDPRRPALEVLPNLSLNALDALRATRAECSGTACHCLENLRFVTNIHGDIEPYSVLYLKVNALILLLSVSVSLCSGLCLYLCLRHFIVLHDK